MVAFSHSRPQSLRFFWSRGRRDGRLPLVNDIKPEDEWLWGREWLSVAISFNFEQTRRSFCLQKNEIFRVAILKCCNMEVIQKVKKLIELTRDKEDRAEVN